MQGPGTLHDAIAASLGGHAPYSRMAAGDLALLASHLRLAYWADGRCIAGGDAGPSACLHIVQAGHVRHAHAGAEGEVLLGPGETFPVAAAADDAWFASGDTFCYVLDPAPLGRLLERSAPLRDYLHSGISTLQHSSHAALHRDATSRALGAGPLLAPVESLLRRPPIACAPATPIDAALRQMSAASVGTIAITGDDGRPLGIFTLTDLMERVALPGLSLQRPVAEVMTSTPETIEARSSAQDAVAQMALRGVHQLLVTRDGALCGVVSERDLFALQRVTLRSLRQRMRDATDLAGLAHAARDLPGLVDGLLAQGLAGEQLTRVVTACNDALVHRVTTLLAARFSLPRVPWCWLALGSEGRAEQTVASDQDNALVFAADGAAAATRRALLPWARAVNEALAECGHPLCPGNIMAGNPECCLELGEWRERFGDCLSEPTPEALLQANIYFDFRPVAGAAQLATELRDWLLRFAPEGTLFLGLMVSNALQCEPPLAMLRTFRTDDAPHAGTLDLKTHGTRLFVDGARVLALAAGIPSTHTAERLASGLRALNLGEREVAGIMQSFEFLQLLRLRAQRGLLGEPAPGAGGNANRIDPYALSDPDQRLLKEAFRQARLLQSLLGQSVRH